MPTRNRAAAKPRLTARIGLLLGLLSVMVVLLLVGLAELAARALVRTGPSAEEKAFVDDAAAQLAPCGAADQLGPRGDGRPRIAIVGESSGQYLGDALGRLRARGAGDFHLANCGRLGAALEHVERRFDEALAAGPDAIVIVFGHNLQIRHITTPLGLGAARLRQHLRLLHLRAKPVDPTARTPDPAARLETFERFLRRAAEAARRRGVRLVVATLTPNLWLPPLSMPSAEEALAPLRIARLLGDGEGAPARLDALVLPDAAGAAAVEFERGVWRASAGDASGARTHLRRAADLDPRADRVLDAANALLRRVSAEEKLLLLDSEQARAEAGGGTTGWESVEDHCHLHADLFEDEAGRALALLGLPAPSPRPIAERPSRLRRVHGLFTDAIVKHGASLGGRGDERALSLAYLRLLTRIGATAQADLDDVVQQLDDPPAAGRAPLDDAARSLLLRGAAGGAFDAGLRDRARAWNERATSLGDARSQAAAWAQRGRFDLAEGHRAAATASFERALALDAGHIEARAALDRLRPPPR